MRVFTMATRLGPLTIWESDKGLARLEYNNASVERIKKFFGIEVEWSSDMESVRQVEAYLAGRLYEFDLPLDIDETGTEFQRKAWRALLTIPYGELINYSELALRMDCPTTIRAAGQANQRNPIALVVPCHRVIRTSGDLGGYIGGAQRKRALLNIEKTHVNRYNDYKRNHAKSSGVIEDSV
ncbi:methylated-DNA--protein-cysteine methyltransferase [Clostridia bacterium]|nr:methylated-DNA--protein-cysteine methyltransferase [Clostridia bacterium]